MPSLRARILLWSSLSGLLWALAWPAVGGITWLAFIAWLPLLHAERIHDQRAGGRRIPFYPYALPGFFIWNALATWWFFAVSEPMVTKVVSVAVPVLGNTLLMGIPWWLSRWVKRTAGARWGRLALPVLWLAFERLHHDWDLQWPWLSLGNAFAAQPAWVQWYEHTGALGGTVWVWAVSLALQAMLMAWPHRRRKALALGAATALAVSLPIGASVHRFNQYRHDQGRPMEVVVVQPNIDPYREKFGGMDALEQLERMLALAEPHITGNTRLVVFPETALQETGTVNMTEGGLLFNGLWENDLPSARSVQRLQAFQQQHPGVAVLCGMSSDRWFRGEGDRPLTARRIGDSPYWYEAYNAALWMPAQGGIESYHKSKLVAGVELMPFEEVLGPLGTLALDLGGTTGSLGQQEERSVLRDASSDLAIVPAICYESVFGEHIAAHVRNGGSLIAVMTNDGWWGDSPGYRQHLTFSSLRAIETRRDVVRSANTGISCVVDQRGIVRQGTDWWVPTAFAATVRLNEEVTFFVRHGDLIGRSASWLALALLLATAIRSAQARVRPRPRA